jgi:hypothetical protein
MWCGCRRLSCARPRRQRGPGAGMLAQTGPPMRGIPARRHPSGVRRMEIAPSSCMDVDERTLGARRHDRRAELEAALGPG